ncbi:hypothetical protein BDE18_3846 [Paracoccus pantotrophus]|uniref:DUF2214 domain-containing protein n=1 Tax=Paracoccus pantotrophus TaxID=82367 RepID=A0A1I5FTM1_PARPN|nr:DUF6644 family protein [Paracoccus pantotrophus]MDF3854209.1 DUF2214 domain-containing protein [Paracoccus pantotrophus]QFG36488.1 DUF2214 domain-containing protein [Paracoccus pantotrophus]QLH16848.1 DUF2214 domain-containing protein [Paracoccus pantotrophus]RKS42920.1 hypothetical protein BDE18_3846 [Paracoccus pantotrophus]RNI14960.1 DUF2214 domain-containing protein [Paracoccus pantotrophus]
MQELAAWAEGTALAAALRRSGHLYMVVNATHILGVALLLGAIVPLDLRLVGIVRGGALRVLAPFLSRAAGMGLAITLATGPVLWSVAARDYLANAAFRWKIALIALGLLVVALQHAGKGWRQAVETGTPGLDARILAALSLAIWLSVLLAGRWIGFL